MNPHVIAQTVSGVIFQVKYISIYEIVFLVILAVPTIYAMLGAPFVPTHMIQVERMIAAAHLKKGLKVYDLGCGDGRLVHVTAAKYGCKSVGYEYSPLIWLWAKFLAIFWRGGEIRFGNIWNQNFSDADVIFCYLLPQAMKKFEKELVPLLKRGTIVVSHAFPMPTYPIYKKIPRDGKHAPIAVYKISAKKQSSKSKRK